MRPPINQGQDLEIGMKDDPGPEPRYKWTYTWPGENHKDYVGYDGDRQIGRIFFDAAGPTKGLWRWASGAGSLPCPAWRGRSEAGASPPADYRLFNGSKICGFARQ